MNAIINARIYDYETYIENGYLLFDEKIVEVGEMKNFKNKSFDKVEDFHGDLLMPTFVCAHSHIYSIFARGLALPFNPKNFQDIKIIEQEFSVLPIRPAFRKYAESRNLLRQKGTPIDHMDLFVASVALFNDMTLVSHNTKHFERIEGLNLADWQ